MRKTLTLIALGLATSAFAQLNVTSKGQAIIGTRASNIGIAGTQSQAIVVDPVVPQPVEIDSVATLVLLGKGTFNTNGYISFGDGSKVSVGEIGSTYYNDMLVMNGYNGLQFNLGNRRYFYARGTNPSSTDLTFSCALKANAFNVASDVRLKKDIEPLDDAWESLSKISSIAYTLKPKPVLETGDEEVIEDAAPDTRRHFGFSAQEVREIFPELVTEDSEGWLSIDYIGFIPILVDAVKNLQTRNGELEEEIADLRNGGDTFRLARAGTEGIPASVEALSMEQNQPNPFTETTSISLTIPETVASASLYVYDMQGTQVMKFDITDRGNTAVTIDGKTLRPGMYLYSLIADGKEISTKRMILTD